MRIRMKLYLGFGALVLLSALQDGLAVKEAIGIGQLVSDTYDKSLMTISFARSAQTNFLFAENILESITKNGVSDLDEEELEERLEELIETSEAVAEDLEVAD
jgi:hypothetical protein